MKKIFTLLLLLLLSINEVKSQDDQSRVITTAVPFLTIAADARASGLGDIGVVTSPDAYSQQWNAAKYVFAEREIGIGVSYTPFLAELVNDISLLQGNFYKRNERSAFAFGLRFFGLGEIELRQNAGDPGEIVRPNEFAIDGSYALKLSDNFSMAVAGRYIRSNLRLQQVDADAQAGNTFAVDISGYYQSEEIAYSNFNGKWRLGFNVSNIGPKISFENGGQENFIPTNLGIGAGYDFIFDEANKLTVSTEFNKLLVPTPRDFDGDGDIDSEDNDIYQDISFFSGIFESFGDAPDGFSEELEEVTWALSAEYWYQESFALRAGYFNESEDKGARKFFTLGAGFQFKAATIDVSYLFSSSSVRNPLENTLRFSITFNLGNEFIEF